VPRSLGYRNLLVPVSPNSESERAMDVACRLAADHGATISAVAVVEIPPELPLDAHMTAEEAAAHRLLERAAAIADTYGVDVAPRILRAREAAAAIVARAEQRHVEIIVIGAPRKQRLRRRAPFGSTVAHVLKNATCRVMVIAEGPDAASLAKTAAA
jgi:nucleotide-binding universal stress UspA family protein